MIRIGWLLSNKFWENHFFSILEIVNLHIGMLSYKLLHIIINEWANWGVNADGKYHNIQNGRKWRPRFFRIVSLVCWANKKAYWSNIKDAQWGNRILSLHTADEIVAWKKPKLILKVFLHRFRVKKSVLLEYESFTVVAPFLLNRLYLKDT